MSGQFSAQTIILISPDKVYSKIEDEAVILDTRHETCYVLDSLGAHIWALIEQPRTIAEIERTLLEESVVEPDRLSQRILTVVTQLFDAKLIEVQYAPAVPTAPAVATVSFLRRTHLHHTQAKQCQEEIPV